MVKKYFMNWLLKDDSMREYFKLNDDKEVIYEGGSEFHHISIIEEAGLRTLCFGKLAEESETAINIKHPDRAAFEYPGLMLASLVLRPNGGKILMLGLGGGYIPTLIKNFLPNYNLTVVEIDPLVLELASTYFNFVPEKNVSVEISEGRKYIEQLPDKSIDQIWLDAFNGSYIPKELMSREFLELCASKLSSNGLLVQNLHKSQPYLYDCQLKTMEDVFGSYLTFEGVECSNAVLVSGFQDNFQKYAIKDLQKMAKNFRTEIGPYNLLKEIKKLKHPKSSTKAKVIYDISEF